MTGLSGCGDIRHLLGVYVVGAIDPAERAVVDTHLGRCPGCREELAGLAGLPALLGRVPVSEAERLARPDGPGGPGEPPGRLLESILRQVAARRRARGRRVILAAAAAAVIAIGGGIGVGAAVSGGSRPSAVIEPPAAVYQRATGSNAQTHASMVVDYSRLSWGTGMRVRVSGVPDGTTCKLWVVNSSGRRLAVGGWRVTRGHENTWYWASSSIPATSVRSFDITSGGRMLVSAAPAYG